MEKDENGLCKCKLGIFDNGECKYCHPTCVDEDHPNNCIKPNDIEGCGPEKWCPPGRTIVELEDGAFKCPPTNDCETDDWEPCPCDESCEKCKGEGKDECLSSCKDKTKKFVVVNEE